MIGTDNAFLHGQVKYLASHRVEFGKAGRCKVGRGIARIKCESRVEFGGLHVQQVERVQVADHGRVGVRMCVMRVRVVEFVIGRDKEHVAIRRYEARVSAAVKAFV